MATIARNLAQWHGVGALCGRNMKEKATVCRTMRCFLLLGWAGWVCGTAGAVEPSTSESAARDQWVATHLSDDPPALPFSFLYGERPSSALLSTWNVSPVAAVVDGLCTRLTRSYTDPETSLVIACEAFVYADAAAVEWSLHFENRGDRDTPLLSEVWPGDMRWTADAPGGWILHHADGSQAAPTDFQPRATPLGPGTTLRFSPEGGRSSDGAMPYFNLVAPDGQGRMLAVGWTGQWTACFSADAASRVTVRAGLERMRVRLHPGERIRTPSMLVLFYSGDATRGHNLWRQLMLRHYTPRPGGRPVEPPVAASGATIGFNNVREENQIAGATNVAAMKLPVDTWWIDAGWTLGGFPEGMGTWDADPARFPNGLRPVGEAVHGLGLKFLVWFEPERVMPNSWLRNHHPDWLLAPSGLPEALTYQRDWRLLDLGNPEARAWATSTLSEEIGGSGIDIYRQDCNLHPLYYWRTAEPEDRQGMTEIRYVEGLYTFLDDLVRDHPELLVDNCASGGRRLDFEMMRRSLPLWRSDYCWDPVGAQCITYGLSYWAPLHGLGAVSAEPYDFRSGLGANVSWAFDYYNRGAAFWPGLIERAREYLAVRPYFRGDYYPLTPYAAGNDVWMAWQFDRPDLGEGLVQAFRRADSPAAALPLTLHALEPEADYEVNDFDGAEPAVLKGSALMSGDWTVAVDRKPGAAMIVYKRAAR